MKTNFVTHICMKDSTHVFKSRDNQDGMSCPICRCPVLTRSYNSQKDNSLPGYQDLMKLRRKSYKKSQCLKCEHIQRSECSNGNVDVFVCEKCKGASVDVWVKDILFPPQTKSTIENVVDMNTDKLQLKLRAIAKHTTALADALDDIDKS